MFSSSDHIVNNLSQTFSLQYMGTLSYFLGVKVAYHGSSLFLSQQQYILDILKHAGLTESKPTTTHLPTSVSLSLGDILYLRTLFNTVRLLEPYNMSPYPDPISSMQSTKSVSLCTLQLTTIGPLLNGFLDILKALAILVYVSHHPMTPLFMRMEMPNLLWLLPSQMLIGLVPWMTVDPPGDMLYILVQI